MTPNSKKISILYLNQFLFPQCDSIKFFNLAIACEYCFIVLVEYWDHHCLFLIWIMEYLIMNDHQVISCLRVESLEISFAGFGLLAHFFHLFLLCLICLLVEYSNTKSLFLLNRYLFEGYKKDYCSCFFEEIYLI